MSMIVVRNWSKHFENNRSKTVTSARWVPIPNRHDSEGYALMMAEKDAAEIFAAWILILQVASRCQPRGSLLRDDGTPITLDVLSIRTRAPVKWFDKAIPFLCKVGWIEVLAGDCQSTDTQLPADCQQPALNGRNGMEGKKEGNEAEEFFNSWNSLGDPFPAIRSMSEARKTTLRARLKEPFWVEHWREALGKISTVDFLRGKNDRGWIADAEFFLRPDTVLKIIEGKYNDASKPKSETMRGLSSGPLVFDNDPEAKLHADIAAAQRGE